MKATPDALIRKRTDPSTSNSRSPNPEGASPVGPIPEGGKVVSRTGLRLAMAVNNSPHAVQQGR
ncbi:hypothetical protein GCM10022293_30550 [Azospirillum formosense]